MPQLVLGDRLGDVAGVVGYAFGNFEGNATRKASTVPAGLGRENTALGGADRTVTVASSNVLNSSLLPEDDSQRATLASQIVNNPGAPDVIARQEIQDNFGQVDDGTTDATLILQAPCL